MNSHQGSSRRANIILLIVSIIICLILAEMAIRILFSTPEYNNRFLFWSSPHFLLDELGAVRYYPNEKVREIAVYDQSIEYDVRYHTNNMGLIDTVDYPESMDGNEKGRYIALVGDSLAAGSGATPWIPVLREQVQAEHPSVHLYNLGVAGAGIEHFYRLLKSISHHIHFTDIVILAISNDFQRPFWRPLTSPTEIRFCPFQESDEVCSKRLPVARVIDFDVSEAQINALVAEVVAKRAERDAAEGVQGIIPKATGWLRKSRLFDLGYSLYHDIPLFAAGEQAQRVSAVLKRIVEKENFRMLEKIRDQYPDTNIYFVHLPEKQEVDSNRYELELREEVEALGIKYFPALQQCDWSREMFYRRDPHPNELGYKNITTCVKDYLYHSLSIN